MNDQAVTRPEYPTADQMAQFWNAWKERRREGIAEVMDRLFPPSAAGENTPENAEPKC